METIYNTTISEDALDKNIRRLTNQLWKLIPMRENHEDWKVQLDTTLLELVGLNEIFKQKPENFVILISKLKGLEIEDTDFFLYRKTVFECISLLREKRL